MDSKLCERRVFECFFHVDTFLERMEVDLPSIMTLRALPRLYSCFGRYTRCPYYGNKNLVKMEAKFCSSL